jgi:photosynthetic reaction center H subunit
MDVVAADGEVAGTVKDLWVDLAEPRILYYEVELSPDVAGDDPAAAGNNPLLPAGFARAKLGQGQIRVASILSHQFRHVPRTASPDQITRLEEDKVTAYYGGGHLYAKPSRQEPLI